MQYRRMDKAVIMASQGEPHTFAVCAKALYIFAEEGNSSNISFVISGESGAGKTESTKHILSFFTLPRDGSDKKDPISEAIMAGNPILEAFGNATTARNNNSSRFGRLIRLFMQVEFDAGVPAPIILGGDVSPFLLERSRITHASEKERSYHVFYQMCKSLSAEELEALCLPADWKQLNLLKRTKLFDVPNSRDTHDQNEWKDVNEAFGNIKMTAEEVQMLKECVAAVLLFGQIELEQVGDNAEEQAPKDQQTVEHVKKML